MKNTIRILESRAFLCVVGVVLASLLAACGSKNESDGAGGNAVVENDATTLSTRVQLQNVDIPLVNADGASLGGLAPSTETFGAVQVAALRPPTVNGVTVQATDVAVFEKAAFVAYNTAGDAYGGAIDEVSIHDIRHISIKSSLSMPSMDMNGVATSATAVYVVGASGDSATPGLLRKISLNGTLFSAKTSQYSLPSFAGTSVRVANGSVYAVSGDAGGLTVWGETTMAQTLSVPVPDARAVAAAPDGSITILSGQPAKATVLSAAGAVTKTVSFTGNTIAQSKSTIQIGPIWSLASLGDGGAAVFCNATGAIIAAVPEPTVPGLSAAKSVTNAASSAGGLVFMANGEAGVYVYSLRDKGGAAPCYAGTLTLLGKLGFPAGFSANGVFYADETLYVVDGLGGLNILSVTYVNTAGDLSTRL